MSSSTDKILDPAPQHEVKRGIESLLTQLAGDKPTKFPVSVQGNTLMFRYPSGISDIRGYEKGGFEFLMRVKSGEGLSKQFKDALAIRELDDDDVVTAYALHYWSHADDKIDEIQAVKMVGYSPSISNDIVFRVDQEHHKGAMVVSFGGVIEKKKDLNPTDGNSCG